MAILNKRALHDANLEKTSALPVAGATVNGPSLDLTMQTAFRVPSVELLISVPATPALVDTKNIVFTLQDSADNVTFANVVGFPTLTVTGAGGAGAAAASVQAKLPLGLRRYIRVVEVADAAAGDSSGVTATLALVF